VSPASPVLWFCFYLCHPLPARRNLGEGGSSAPCHTEALVEAGQKIWISENILQHGAKFSEGMGKQKLYENRIHFSSRTCPP
jgi:hypothetical protein